MIEIPEAIPFARQANALLTGLEVADVSVLDSPHKFAWLNQDQTEYKRRLNAHKITQVVSSAHFIRFIFDHLVELAIAEDVTCFYGEGIPKTMKNQLRINFTNGHTLVFQVKLYGFFLLGTKEELYQTQKYYQLALDSISPLDSRFTYEFFKKSTDLDSSTGSVKQALATKQHIPGLGNGTLQDVLFHAKIHPKRKLSTMTEEDKESLYHALQEKIGDMVSKGGRDLQKDLLGNPGGYVTLMTSSREFCPTCHHLLIKEAYLGGKVIYCPSCQK